MRRLLLVGALALCGCQEGQRGFFAQDGVEALNIPAPRADRCQRYPKGSSENKGCLQLKEQAVEWVRKLNSGDQFCLENNFGDEVGGTCKARGVLLDSGKDGFLIEVRDAKIDSKWVPYNQRKVWFASGAIVDQYLKDKGYE